MGLDGSPVKLIKEEPIQNWPAISEPLTISSSPERKPEKDDGPLRVDLVSINDNGDRDEKPRQLNFCDQVTQYTYMVDHIKHRTGDTSPLPTTEEPIAKLTDLMFAAKTSELREHYKYKIKLLEARTQKLQDLFMEDIKNNPRAPRRPAAKINHRARQKLIEKNLLSGVTIAI